LEVVGRSNGIVYPHRFSRRVIAVGGNSVIAVVPKVGDNCFKCSVTRYFYENILPVDDSRGRFGLVNLLGLLDSQGHISKDEPELSVVPFSSEKWSEILGGRVGYCAPGDTLVYPVFYGCLGYKVWVSYLMPSENYEGYEWVDNVSAFLEGMGVWAKAEPLFARVVHRQVKT
jgi:hypothetical protein